jgi:hypothetical protein
MKNHRTLTLFMAICAAPLPGILHAAEPELEEPLPNQLNRFSFDARFGFNIKARFKDLGRLSLRPSTRTTPDGDSYNYDDGYVRQDVSGNYGGQTWNWGYDRPGQISGNTIQMHRSKPVGSSASPDTGGDDVNPGAEFTYNRELGRRDDNKLRYGIEAAVNYLNVDLSDRGSFAAGVVRTTDAYPFTPGTTPPLTPPSYQGSYGGPGFVIGDTPSSSTTGFAPGGATVAGRRQFEADIWGFRLGPYMEIPMGTNFDLSLSAGVAVGVVSASASWNETVIISGSRAATSRGSGDDLGVVWGGYVSAKVAWHLSQHWSVEAGAQFQSLGTYDQKLGGRKVELDLSRSVFGVAGVSYSF